MPDGGRLATVAAELRKAPDVQRAAAQVTRMNRLTRKRLVDEMIDGYVDWRQTCHLVEDAYHSWSTAGRARAPVTFGLYSVALDREERAAEVYADLVQRVGHLVASSSGLAGEPLAPAWQSRA
jgi:hypothetical protein